MFAKITPSCVGSCGLLPELHHDLSRTNATALPAAQFHLGAYYSRPTHSIKVQHDHSAASNTQPTLSPRAKFVFRMLNTASLANSPDDSAQTEGSDKVHQQNMPFRHQRHWTLVLFLRPDTKVQYRSLIAVSNFQQPPPEEFPCHCNRGRQLSLAST